MKILPFMRAAGVTLLLVSVMYLAALLARAQQRVTAAPASGTPLVDTAAPAGYTPTLQQ